jgi:hypothetical protein
MREYPIHAVTSANSGGPSNPLWAVRVSAGMTDQNGMGSIRRRTPPIPAESHGRSALYRRKRGALRHLGDTPRPRSAPAGC